MHCQLVTLSLIVCFSACATEKPAPPAPTSQSGVDTHVHLGAIATMQTAEDIGAAADALIGLMDGRGVKKSLVVIVPSTGAANIDDLGPRRAAVSARSSRLGLMAGGDTFEPYLQGTAPDKVTPALEQEFDKKARELIAQGAVGFGEMISLHLCLGSTHSYQHVPADHPLFLRLADIAAELKVPIDLHMEAVSQATPMPDNLKAVCSKNPDSLPASLPALSALLAHNRAARIVWQHIGWDNTGGMTPAVVRQMLADNGNLYIALRVEQRPQQVGSKEPMKNRILDSSGRIVADFKQLIVDYPDRVMIGSDEFVSPSGSPTTGIASFQLSWSIVDQLPADLAAKVMGTNAQLVYGL
jgi:hypothetical protein